MALAQEVADKETVAVRAPLTGWLLKRKNNKAVSRVISSTNRRFFTLDFTGQVLYYSHNESNKSVSQPLAFRHILGVEPVCITPEQRSAEAQQSDEVPQERPTSKSSTGSGFRIPKMPSLPGLSRRPSLTEQHGFSLVCTSKSLELVCSSQSEAEMWIDAIREAIALGSSEKHRSSGGHDEAKAEISTAPGSSRDSQSPQSPQSPRSDAAPQDSEEERTVNLVELAAEKAKEQASWVEPASEAAAVCRESSEPAQDRGTDVIEVAPVSAVAIPKDTAGDSDALALESTRSEHRVAGLPPRLPQKPTRPAEEPPASAESKPGEGEEAIREMKADSVSPRNDAQAWEASFGHEASVQRSASERYADKAEGLTLAQRLSQLDFSDDEDDDVAAGGDEKPVDAKKEVCSVDPVTSLDAAGKKAGVVVEACESFVQDADSDED